ncbi:MAG TPA: S8 family serine peptidase [Coleofasciculaceae cyanobacterium]|jgi:hypothetical protein
MADSVSRSSANAKPVSNVAKESPKADTPKESSPVGPSPSKPSTAGAAGSSQATQKKGTAQTQDGATPIQGKTTEKASDQFMNSNQLGLKGPVSSDNSANSGVDRQSVTATPSPTGTQPPAGQPKSQTPSVNSPAATQKPSSVKATIIDMFENEGHGTYVEAVLQNNSSVPDKDINRHNVPNSTFILDSGAPVPGVPVGSKERMDKTIEYRTTRMVDQMTNRIEQELNTSPDEGVINISMGFSRTYIYKEIKNLVMPGKPLEIPAPKPNSAPANPVNLPIPTPALVPEKQTSLPVPLPTPVPSKHTGLPVPTLAPVPVKQTTLSVPVPSKQTIPLPGSTPSKQTALPAPESKFSHVASKLSSSYINPYSKENIAKRADVQALGLTAEDLNDPEKVEAAIVKYVDGRLDPANSPFQQSLKEYQAVTKQAADNGQVIVVAAGNEHSAEGKYETAKPGHDLNFLAQSDNVISAAASNDNGTSDNIADDKIAEFSSRGGGQYDPTVTAPGVDVPVKNGKVSGTSFSAPTVSAAIVNMQESNPSLTFDQIKSVLQETAVDTAATAAEEGAGMLDAKKAVEVAKSLDSVDDQGITAV